MPILATRSPRPFVKLSDPQRRVLQALFDAGGRMTTEQEFAFCTRPGSPSRRAFNNNVTTALYTRALIRSWSTFPDDEPYPKNWAKRSGYEITPLGVDALRA